MFTRNTNQKTYIVIFHIRAPERLWTKFAGTRESPHDKVVYWAGFFNTYVVCIYVCIYIYIPTHKTVLSPHDKKIDLRVDQDKKQIYQNKN